VTLDGLTEKALAALIAAALIYVAKSLRTYGPPHLFDALADSLAGMVRAIHITRRRAAWILFVSQVLVIAALALSVFGRLPFSFRYLYGLEVALIILYASYRTVDLRRVLGIVQDWAEAVGKWVDEEPPQDYTYKEFKAIYIIDSRWRDEWSRRMVIQANKDVVLMKTVGISQAGSQGRMPLRWRIPAFLALRATTDPGKGGVLLLPKRVARGWAIGSLLTVPIRPGEVRSVTISGRHPDVWSRLRKSGNDNGFFTLARPAALFEIIITLPGAVQNAALKPVAPACGDVEEDTDRHGRRQLIWRISNAQPGKYEYSVLMSRAKPSATQD
jgi:hypothetical protein